ncbi:MAG: glycosyltransferase family 39 protein [Anaerolineae bacterium]
MTTNRVSRSWIWILLVVLLAFGLRLYALDRQDIWGDEAFSIWLSGRPLAEVVAGGADTHPPLYPTLLFFWERLAGTSPLAVRLLSALVGTLLVPVVYVLARRVEPLIAVIARSPPLATKQSPASDEKPTGIRHWRLLRSQKTLARNDKPAAVPLLAALLVAVSPVLVYYAQETRMYGLVTLLAAASVYWTLRFLQQPRSGAVALACWATGLAAAYTHYYAFFVILAENAVLLPVLWRRRQDSGRQGRRGGLGRWLAVQIGIALAYVPWIAVQSGFLGGKASARFGEWDLATALRIVGQTAGAFSAGLALAPAWTWAIAAVFGFVVVIGLVLALRRGGAGGALVAGYLLLPLLLAWAVNPIMPFFYARYLLLIAPAFYLLAAWGLAALGRAWAPLAAVAAVLLLAGSGLGLAGYYGDDAYAKGRYGQMMTYVEEHAQPGDGLLLANPLQRPLYDYYGPQGLAAYYLPRPGVPLEDPRTAEELETIAGQHPRLWLVRFGNPAEYDPAGYLVRWLATHGSRAYFGGWVDADLALYVMAPAGGSGEIQHPLRADLGGRVRLLGYSLGAEQVAPGETLLLTLYWQALAPMEERYTVFTHLLDAGGQIQAQMDSEPQGGGLPTDRWAVGQVVQDNYALEISPEAQPGPHLLEVGMYLLATMDRLPVQDPDSGAVLGDRVVLGTVEVLP